MCRDVNQSFLNGYQLTFYLTSCCCAVYIINIEVSRCFLRTATATKATTTAEQSFEKLQNKGKLDIKWR